MARVAGRLDAVTSPAFEQELTALVGDDAKHAVLDMEDLEYVSSAGLRSILSVGKALQKASGKMVVCNVSGMIREVFAISGFDCVFPMADSVDAAIAQIRS